MNVAQNIKDFVVNYFTLTDDLLPQPDAEAAIREGVSFKGTNILILIIAIFIASLGLNVNSTAVIIGAMLISPLMGPIIGIGLGVGVHDFTLIRRSLRNLLMAAGFSMLASTIYFLISPVNENHSELLARTSPTIYDVLIGFFGGGAGIVALASKSKGNVLPGVAIATALMPPLCTAGYGIATGQMNYFIGATYLFLINSIYISLATYVGVKLFRYRPVASVDPQRAKRVMRVVYTVAILTMIPSIYLTYNMLRINKFETRASEFVAKECRFPDTQVLKKNATYVDGVPTLAITLIGKVLPEDSLRLALAPRLKSFGLAGTQLKFVQGMAPSAEGIQGSSDLKDVFLIAQQTISSQQNTIDSLKNVNREMLAEQSLSVAISPELKVIFPQIGSIAVNRSVFANVATEKRDTVNVAIVHFLQPMNQSTLTKFREYLEARLGMKNIDIVESKNPADFVNTPTNVN